jgi:tetratricopeptide (TPR) repeat protein
LLVSCSQKRAADSHINGANDFLKYNSNSEISQKSEHHYINGLTKQQTNKWAESIIDFNQALKYDSSEVILYTMAKSYLAINQINLALECLISSMERNPDFLPNLELLSDTYVKVGEIGSAIKVYESIVETQPNYDRRYRLAELFEKKDKTKSVEIYHKLYEETSNKLLQRKLLSILPDESDEYYEILDDFYQNYKTDSKIAFDLLKYKIDNKEPSEIFSHLDIIDLNIPTEKLSYFYGTYGEVIYRSQDTNISLINDYSKRIDNRFHFDPRIQNLVGFLEAKAGNLDESYKRFSHSIKLSDENTDISIRAASFFLSIDKDSIASLLLEQAILDNFTDPTLYYYLGLSYEVRNLNKSIDAFNSSIKLNPKFVDPVLRLAVIMEMSGDFSSSNKYYNQALNLEANNPVVCNNFAYSLAEQNKQLDFAKNLVEKALKFEPKNPIYLDTYSWVLYKLGDNEKALKINDKALKRANNIAEIYEHRGLIELKLNRLSAAKESFKKALELDSKMEISNKKLKEIE